jgi:hypothetical protein
MCFPNGTLHSIGGRRDATEAAMPHLVATADRIDYWIRRHVVPYPPQSKVNSTRERRAALTEIGKALRDQYDALATPIPPQLVVLVKQFEARNPTYH